jgi:tetratricopeptide (TPR) repeat protein
MRLLFSIALLLSFTACGDYFAKPGETETQESNMTDPAKASDVSKQPSNVAYIRPESPRSKQKNMVHIVRQANGTSIDFWIDLYNDDVKIDYEFDNSAEPYVAPKTKSVHSKNAVKIDQSSKKSNQSEIDILQLYLASYEKAQKLTYEKKYSKALVAINQALSLTSKVEQGWKLKGSILYKLNDKVGAKKAWKQALKINPYAEDVKKSIASLKR